MKEIPINIIKLFIRYLKSFFCKHKFKTSSIGSYKNTHIGDIDVYYLKCKKCYKKREIITYK